MLAMLFAVLVGPMFYFTAPAGWEIDFGKPALKAAHIEAVWQPSPQDGRNILLSIQQIDDRVGDSLDKKIDRLDKKIDHVDGKVDSLRHDMNRRFDRIDERFDRVDERFNRVEKRLDHD